MLSIIGHFRNNLQGGNKFRFPLFCHLNVYMKIPIFVEVVVVLAATPNAGAVLFANIQVN